MTDIAKHPILKQCHDLGVQIEQCIASKPVTDASVMASELLNSLDGFVDEYEMLQDKLYPIEAWCRAYPIRSFQEPDWKEVEQKLGKNLLSRVSASNMRHVVDGIQRIITADEDRHGIAEPE